MHRTLKKRINVSDAIQETEFVAFDTELTGLDFKRDSIISIGAIKMKGSRIFPGKMFYRLVKPESELKTESVVVHGLTHSDLAGAENLQSVITDFIDFIGDSVLIGHFVFIDLKFLNRAMKKLFGFPLQSPVIDTFNVHEWLYDNDYRFSRHYRGMTIKKDLFSMSRKYGIKVEKTHNAFYDAYLTAQLFQRFIHFLPDCGINRIDELLMVGKS
jgi:DNA polymerase-3 subunit epsilon